jgi:hypothetical protein
MGFSRLHDALERLTTAVNEVETELRAMKAEHGPLASHVFISRRHYRNAKDTKGGKRRQINARLIFNTACELGFRGSLGEWARLRGDRSFASVANSCSTRPRARKTRELQPCPFCFRIFLAATRSRTARRNFSRSAGLSMSKLRFIASATVLA